jgi:hypothetical protein
MDADRFDALARTLTPGSRRSFVGTLSAVAGSALAPLLARDDATAHDLSKKCKNIKDKKKRKACVKKAKKHKAQHAAEGSASTVASTCGDGVRNGGETDIDCGGPCPPCADGQACATRSDCQSRVCTNNTCRVPTCSDGVKNGNETDIDCGGGICPDCAIGQACLVDGDCEVPPPGLGVGGGTCCNKVCAECCDHTDCVVCSGPPDDVRCGYVEQVCESRTCRGCSVATAPATNWCTVTAAAHGCGIVDPDRGTPCYCIETLTGGNVCTFGASDDVCQFCETDFDCPSNHVCVNADGCCPRVDEATPATACVFDGCQ